MASSATRPSKMRLKMRLLFAATSCLLLGCAQPSIADTQNPHSNVITLKTRVIDEASGLASSQLAVDALWMHNDSGDRPRLYAVNSQTGALLNTVLLNDAEATDWEDMASYRLRDQAWLLIGDIGDNRARRQHLTLYGLPEPDGDSESNKEYVQPAWQIDFRYEDGPRDAEALAVDTQQQMIYILSKREQPPRLYRLPLSIKNNDQIAIATHVSDLTTLPPPTQQDIEADPKYGPWSSLPTAMDISPSGLELIVITYKDAYLYRRQTAEDWASALARAPRVIDLPQMPQTEAGGFSADGKTLWAASEQLPAQLSRHRLPNPAALEPKH